ncbi:PREDICTED: probable phosphatase phospho2 [Polistes canadensis]|uniref:probable phosphatase phospho2 n=1 Tax=Polistes canadensis TaxID=91411 RepID=UPI000718B576|nr:PREDICTED: probable phosphatase phospho2 [Polistes canadensis]
MDLPTLIVFDFDHTIVDDNTDLIVRNLLPDDQLTDEVQNLYLQNGWTLYMNKIFELLHKNSIGLKEIEAAIIDIPPSPGFDALIKELHIRGYEIIIISDSNSLLIDIWLKSRQLDNLISKVFTNPAHVSDDGMIKINMYHVQDFCKLSMINLCKGHILENYIKERLEEKIHFKRIAYVGDGKNDLCPVLRLSENDLAFPRIDYPLLKKLKKYQTKDIIQTVKATIIPWSNGHEILRYLNN